MLKHLQQSVEEEELVWKSKMANSEEQLRVVSYNTSLKALWLFSPHFGHPSLLLKPHYSPSHTLPGFGEGQQAGGRKPKCRTGGDFSALSLNWGKLAGYICVLLYKTVYSASPCSWRSRWCLWKPSWRSSQTTRGPQRRLNRYCCTLGYTLVYLGSFWDRYPDSANISGQISTFFLLIEWHD